MITIIITGVLSLILGFILGGISSTDTLIPNVILAEKELEIIKLEHSVAELRHELQQSKQLKEVLEVLANKTGLPTPKYGDNSCLTVDYANGISWTSHSANYVIPDNVLQYVDDILGGRVIKQEGNKCLVIAKDGTVKTGLTKAKTDKGYTYKLVRE